MFNAIDEAGKLACTLYLADDGAERWEALTAALRAAYEHGKSDGRSVGVKINADGSARTADAD